MLLVFEECHDVKNGFRTVPKPADVNREDDGEEEIAAGGLQKIRTCHEGCENSASWIWE